MRWAGYVAYMGERRGIYRILVGKPRGGGSLGRARHKGRLILRWVFCKWDAGVWTGSSWLRIRAGGKQL